MGSLVRVIKVSEEVYGKLLEIDSVPGRAVERLLAGEEGVDEDELLGKMRQVIREELDKTVTHK